MLSRQGRFRRVWARARSFRFAISRRRPKLSACLWRTVDNGGEVFDAVVTKRRDAEAALKLLRKRLKCKRVCGSVFQFVPGDGRLRLFAEALDAETDG
ncbi:transposase, partial [Oricola indica]|uniref:transposase n=1 Tax=Oricola indica TaxID=2872591 RepID=UPI001CBF8B56